MKALILFLTIISYKMHVFYRCLFPPVPQIHTCRPGPLDEVTRGAQRARLAASQREAGLGRWHHRVHRATGGSRVRDMTERRRWREHGPDCWRRPSSGWRRGRPGRRKSWRRLYQSHTPSPRHVVSGGFPRWELNPCRTLVSCLCLFIAGRGTPFNLWPDFVFPCHSPACSSPFCKKRKERKKNPSCSFTDLQYVGKGAAEGGRECKVTKEMLYIDTEYWVKQLFWKNQKKISIRFMSVR